MAAGGKGWGLPCSSGNEGKQGVLGAPKGARGVGDKLLLLVINDC